MALTPTFKPKPKDTYFIFNTKTGLYSRGGMAVKWGRSPKTWTKGGVKLHLVQHRYFYKPDYACISYNFDTDFIYDMDTNEPATDVTLAGFLIKSSYDDKLKDVNRYRDTLKSYEEALEKATAADLKEDAERYARYVEGHRRYFHDSARDLQIIKEYAVKYGVTL